MMGRRRGFIGTMVAISREADRAHRRSERAARQQHRRLVAAMKAQAQMQEAEYARHETAVFENTIERLCSVHRECSFPVDWRAIADTPPPALRTIDCSETARLELAVAKYRQAWWEKLLRTTWRKRRFEAKLVAARDNQAAAERHAAAEHSRESAAWKETTDVAKEILAGNLETYEDVVADMKCLEELEELGAKPQIGFISAALVEVSVQVSENSVVPAEEKSVSARGKLLTKKMAATRRQEIHQDYVCGAVLRAARELIAVLPVRGVLVHAEMEALDSSTGHLTKQPVVSAYCPREGIVAVNWERVDASDMVSRLAHRMSFKKGKGFSVVERLSAYDFIERSHFDRARSVAAAPKPVLHRSC